MLHYSIQHFSAVFQIKQPHRFRSNHVMMEILKAVVVLILIKHDLKMSRAVLGITTKPLLMLLQPSQEIYGDLIAQMVTKFQARKIIKMRKRLSLWT